jgi:hypothetical protein
VRSAGTSKIDIAWFFIFKDFLLFIILLFNLFNFKRNIFFSLLSLFSIIFFFGYQDIYYLYLNFVTPFLCLSFYEIDLSIRNIFKIQRSIIITTVIFFIALNLFTYINGYRNFQKINDTEKIISIIKKEKPNFLYGFNSLTPAISVITNIPSLSNVNDAYINFFRRGIYNKERLTSQALSKRTIILTQGADYPEINIKQDILDDEIINKEKIYKNCKNILSIPVLSEGYTNRINIFKCY